MGRACFFSSPYPSRAETYESYDKSESYDNSECYESPAKVESNVNRYANLARRTSPQHIGPVLSKGLTEALITTVLVAIELYANWLLEMVKV
eukprot:CAMPEP_0184661742 /NCGR_PEP_ID=MMETSP0308-20130426/39941_1 /TAXON_ID=38269 /ORGANISM="Gloeochaete witrockiana, Strain SAG 46.84" /LENGTH=91 /DNA_ID=CAMNT_0027103261 /DNA_START=510 /DNA_END=781 /DNA_ORIENTATION=-